MVETWIFRLLIKIKFWFLCVKITIIHEHLLYEYFSVGMFIRLQKSYVSILYKTGISRILLNIKISFFLWQFLCFLSIYSLDLLSVSLSIYFCLILKSFTTYGCCHPCLKLNSNFTNLLFCAMISLSYKVKYIKLYRY